MPNISWQTSNWESKISLKTQTLPGTDTNPLKKVFGKRVWKLLR